MRDVFAKKKNASLGGRKVAGDGVEQGCFASAIGPQNGAFFTGEHRETDIVHGTQSPKGAGDVFQDKRLGRHQRPFMASHRHLRCSWLTGCS